MSDRRWLPCCSAPGYRVALHDEPGPTTPRRGMAFTDAVFDGVAVLDGLTARRVESPAELRRALTVGAPLPVAVWAFAEILRAADWAAVIDARMRKRVVPEGQRGLAPLTIGLGRISSPAKMSMSRS